MDLSDKILNDFANLFKNQGIENRKATEIYGVIVNHNGKKFVAIDGCRDNLTPLSQAMECEIGDRVLVRIQNHEAIVTGNISSPASARTATNYLKETTDGQGNDALIVGELEGGKPQGAYLLLTSDGLLICDDGGSTVKARITYENDVLYIMGRGTVGIRAQNQRKDQHAEMICSMIDNSPKISLQAWQNGDVENRMSIIGSFDGISMETPKLLGGSGYKPLTINGYEILSSSNSVVFGSSSIRNMIIDAQTNRTYVLKISTIPTGYVLTGIRSIRLSNTNVALYQYSLDPLNNEINIVISGNVSEGYKVDIDIEWFAILAGNIKILSQDIIDLGDGGDEDG